MLRNRLIPVLLLSGNRCVKTIGFKKRIYIGDPINIIKIFNEKEVDEIILLDIDSSRLGSEPNYRLVEDIASECFMPLTYGGGISNICQARRLISCGIEKISVNNMAINNLENINNLTSQFGSQSIVVSVDIYKSFTGQYYIYNSVKRNKFTKAWLNYLKKIQLKGVGELLINSVNFDGKLCGPDLNLISQISNNLTIPFIYQGGISSLNEIRNSIISGADSVAAGSFFCFYGTHKAVLITYPKYNDLEVLLEEKQK